MKIADVMRPFRHAVPVPPKCIAHAHGGSANSNEPDALPGPVTCRHDPQALFASESLGQALRQLEVYGRDGLPVLSADGHQIQGRATSTGVLRALASQVSGAQDEAAQAQAAADWEHADPATSASRPSAPLAGYQVIEITITDDSPAAGQKLRDVPWPPDVIPVSVLHGRWLRPPDPDITLAPGDRVSLLVPAPDNSPSPA